MSDRLKLEEVLLKQYGPTFHGPVLRKVLGFKTQQSFARARRLGQLGVPVFSLPQRRGAFALTTDVAHWLEDCRKTEEKINGEK